MTMKKIVTEICCGSVEDCMAAQRWGGDRIELVSAHFLGGLTPSSGEIYRAKEKVNIPIMAIVRPRMAGFCYSEEEYEVMCYDAKNMLNLGADGIVFGFLKEDGTLDYDRCGRFLEIIGNKQSVFHRALDVVSDPVKTVAQLVDLGVTRVLTSGGKASVQEGADVIKELVETFAGKIEILAGGGVRSDTVCEVIKRTGVHQVHFGGTAYQTDFSTQYNDSICFGTTKVPPNNGYLAVKEETIAAIIKAAKTMII